MRTDRIGRDPEGRMFYVDGCSAALPVAASATQTSSSLSPGEMMALLGLVAAGAIVIRYFMHKEGYYG